MKVPEVLEFDPIPLLRLQNQIFSVNHKNSGKNICVYEKDNEKSSSIAKKLFSEGRVHYLLDGDYSENSEADKLIKGFILSYKS
jgi:hypothetical protein